MTLSNWQLCVNGPADSDHSISLGRDPSRRQVTLDGGLLGCKSPGTRTWWLATRFAGVEGVPFMQELFLNRRNLTPPEGTPGILAQRRGSGGARREISSHLTIRSGTEEYDGWALNISRGGIRVVIEGRIHLGQVLVVEGWDPNDMDAPPRRARVVWSQDEPDGSVVGMEFIDADESVPPPSVPASEPRGNND